MSCHPKDSTFYCFGAYHGMRGAGGPYFTHEKHRLVELYYSLALPKVEEGVPYSGMEKVTCEVDASASLALVKKLRYSCNGCSMGRHLDKFEGGWYAKNEDGLNYLLCRDCHRDPHSTKIMDADLAIFYSKNGVKKHISCWACRNMEELHEETSHSFYCLDCRKVYCESCTKHVESDEEGGDPDDSEYEPCSEDSLSRSMSDASVPDRRRAAKEAKEADEDIFAGFLTRIGDIERKYDGGAKGKGKAPDGMVRQLMEEFIDHNRTRGRDLGRAIDDFSRDLFSILHEDRGEQFVELCKKLTDDGASVFKLLREFKQKSGFGDIHKALFGKSAAFLTRTNAGKGGDGGGAAKRMSKGGDGGGAAKRMSKSGDGGGAAKRMSKSGDGGGAAKRMSKSGDGGGAAKRMSKSGDGGGAAKRMKKGGNGDSDGGYGGYGDDHGDWYSDGGYGDDHGDWYSDGGGRYGSGWCVAGYGPYANNEDEGRISDENAKRSGDEDAKRNDDEDAERSGDEDEGRSTEKDDQDDSSGGASECIDLTSES